MAIIEVMNVEVRLATNSYMKVVKAETVKLLTYALQDLVTETVCTANENKILIQVGDRRLNMTAVVPLVCDYSLQGMVFVYEGTGFDVPGSFYAVVVGWLSGGYRKHPYGEVMDFSQKCVVLGYGDGSFATAAFQAIPHFWPRTDL